MKFYDVQLHSSAQRMRFKEFGGIDLRPILVEGGNYRSRVGSVMPNRFAPAFLMQSSLARTGQNSNFVTEPAINDFFAMPLGTIVSKVEFHSRNNTDSIIAQRAAFGIDSSGNICIGDDISGNAIVLSAETDWFNYARGQFGLINIATGDMTGAAGPVEDPYSIWDVELRTIQIDQTTGAVIGSPAASVVEDWFATGITVQNAAGKNVFLRYPHYDSSAFKPYGIVIDDIPNDIEGRFLNYSQQGPKGYAVMYQGRIRIPFVYNMKSTASIPAGVNLNMGSGVGTQVFSPIQLDTTQILATNLNNASLAGYRAIRGRHQFLLMDQTAIDAVTGAAGTLPEAGWRVQPNRDGKFILQTDTTFEEHTVGHIEVLDSRYPKNQNEIVHSYPGSETTGTDTGGVDQYLYRFVKAVLSVAPAPTQAAYPADQVGIIKAIQDGLFGYAHITVDIS